MEWLEKLAVEPSPRSTSVMPFKCFLEVIIVVTVTVNGYDSSLKILLLMCFTKSVQLILQVTPRLKLFGIQRKPLPLEPAMLLREANRRRASLSTGNMFELLDGHSSFVDG